ncbi:thiamine pyrophosphate-binding protein [Jiangella endophytica]|uniref:thiamine pyrophosphate-binding protein n=1 Tax=Jiangella endophytica TaxID=1623398 RepID=UPI000E349812|nr:thiamine pyrophosphate-binding protein [Jiangella endophytica]
MLVGEAVGRALAQLGVRQAFGVVGSGNFHVTNALADGGTRFVATRHEGGAATMADAYARMSGEVAAVTVHQGCGLTNALTGIAEAAKSRTPLLVLAAEATVPGSNFFVDQPSLASAVGAATVRVASAETALGDVARAYALARHERRTVVVNLPLDVQGLPVDDGAHVRPVAAPAPPPPPDVTELAALLASARRPVLIAGRGARHARAELLALADACGALVATSAVAKGLFHGSPWSLDVSGGFASPLAASLITGADVVVGFGCALNMWTLRHGRLIGPSARVAQVDVDADAIGRHQAVEVGVAGDSAVVASALTVALDGPRPGYRDDELRTRLAAQVRWRDVAYDDWGGGGRIDPRTLTIALDDLLPDERVVAVDSGNFMGYPSMFLSVPDEHGFCFTQAFQSIGLGLATAIGAALARPDRLPVAALGDGGALMAAAELDTARRLGLPMVVVVYNDDAYGAEVHHFAGGEPLDAVTFPDTDIAAVGAGYGFDAVTVRSPADLGGVRSWLDGDRGRPLLVDAKVAAPRGAWWLEEAFRGH